MSSLKLLFVSALALRLGLAVVTEHRPLFPAYYYTDAVLADAAARQVAAARREGRPAPGGSLSQRAYATWLATLYGLFGDRPLLAKAANGVFAALSLVLLAQALTPAFGAGPALASAWACALWPSHVFFTSQNFKDALILLFVWMLLRAALAPRGLAWIAASAAAVALAALRSYELVMCAVASFGGLVASLGRRRAAALLAGAMLAGVALRAPLRERACSFLIAAGDPRYAGVDPLTPSGIASVRRLRQDSDILFGKGEGHKIGTQLFYGQAFASWLDVAAFLPKAGFYVLFMPLPGLYPLAGNIGRALASAENVALLLLFVLAVAGALRRDGGRAEITLMCFFALMTAGSALFEFDLGGASRHKIVYLPAVFPFAFSWLTARRQPRAGKRKVFQVLECGGPGGTGNQVAALCNGLDPSRFDVGLVYAVRPGASAEQYRKLASGASAAHHLPEMVREISPLSDARAFWKLYRLFREEQPDVVHAHSSKAGVLARWAAFFAGVPRVFYTPHGYGFLQQDRGPISRAVYRGVEAATSWIGTIVAVSPSEARFASALSWGKPVETVCDAYLGELPDTLAPEEHHGVLVGSCGRLTYARNPDAFVNLAQRLTDSRNGLKCVWIGGGEQEENVRRHVENMNMPDRLEVTGWLDAAAAQQRLRGLDVLVHYSRWDGLPNAVLEAMAHGLPVVAADVPGARDAVVHGETGFLARTEIELLEHTLKLVDDPKLRRRFGEAGRKRVESMFRREEALRRLEALYAGG